jgi:hypothetical protein
MRMDAPVGDEALERHPRHPRRTGSNADRITAWRVVDDHVHAGDDFERTDVAARGR